MNSSKHIIKLDEVIGNNWVAILNGVLREILPEEVLRSAWQKKNKTKLTIMIAENNISGKGSTSTKTQRWKQFWHIQVKTSMFDISD